MNKVLITGRLAKDHKIGQIPGRTAVCGFSVAVNRKFVNKQTGEREADFTNCTIWGKQPKFRQNMTVCAICTKNFCFVMLRRALSVLKYEQTVNFL